MPSLIDRAGAAGRISLDDALALGSSHGFQEKRDGALSRIATDRRGQVVSVLGRNGSPLTGGGQDLVGCYTGFPSAVIFGEATVHTEAGIRERDAAGFVSCHVFDVAELGGRPVSRRPYVERHALLRDHYERAELREDWSLDETGRAHDATSGRFRDRVPRDARRFPICVLHRDPADVRRIWRDRVEVGQAEGLVCIALAAPLGARKSKIKIKPTDEITCRVLRVEGALAMLEYGGRTFIVSARGKVGADLRVGMLVDAKHDGYTEAGSLPKFPRLSRIRHDLMPAMQTVECQ